MTAIVTAVRAAFPRHAEKELQRRLGVSAAQANRIVRSGAVPGSLRAAFVELLDRAIARRIEEAAEVRVALREIDYAEMVDRAATRRVSPLVAGMPGAAARVAARPDQRPKQLPLIADEEG